MVSPHLPDTTKATSIVPLSEPDEVIAAAAASAAEHYRTKSEVLKVVESFSGAPEIDPKILYSLLKGAGLLPTPSDKNFIFLSVSAYLGKVESELARLCDAEFESGEIAPAVTNKPLFIASDQVLRTEQEIERLLLAERQAMPLTYTSFALTEAEAFKLPYPSGSINVIYDRLGALWHLCKFLTKTYKGISREDFAKVLLIAIKRLGESLKDNGSIVVDAYTQLSVERLPEDFHCVDSTYDVICSGLGDDLTMDELVGLLRSGGFNINFIGAGTMRMAVLTKMAQRKADAL
jgi:hypothetical protein